MRNGVFPAISVSKDVIVISDSSPPNVNFWALRAPGMENNTCHLAATRLQPLPMVNSGCEEMWDTGPRQLDAYERNDYSEPRLLHLPIQRNSGAETPILWPPDAKNWLIGKDPDAGKDWRQEEKGTTEDDMVGRHHQLDGPESEQSPEAGDGQGILECCSP